MSERQLNVSLPRDAMIESYRRWIVDARGLRESTGKCRARMALRFLGFLDSRATALADASPVDVDAFFAENACRWKRLSVRTISGQLRDFLSYAAQEHWCTEHPGMSITSPRIYRHEGLPYFVPWHKVTEMLRATAKDTSRRGRRGHAILMLLATYGVRSSEVVRMKLKDIDWRKETIFFDRSKGGRSQTLPLASSVGDAILRYIRYARPNETGSDCLFLKERVAQGISQHDVYDAARKGLDCVGAKATHLGPHCIRHSVATHLVNSGSTLKEVSEMLGHRSIGTTAIYAKIDLESLREVADMNWGAVL